MTRNWMIRPITLAAACGVFLLGAGEMRAQEGKDLYLAKCATCHGRDGAAKTAMGRSFKVKDVHELAPKMSAEQMIKATKEGKSPNMAGFADQLTDAQIKAVVDYYRSLAN